MSAARRPGPPGGGRTILLAGWLFADLLLVLLVVALSALPAPRPEASATPSASLPGPTTTSAAPSPSPTRPAERGLVIQPCRFTVNVGYSTLGGSGADQVASQLDTQLRAAGVEQRTAGFVLSFGHAPDVNVGQDAARKVNDVLNGRLPAVFGKAPKRGYWTGDSASDVVDVDVFFLADANGDTSLPPRCRTSDR
ncbi:hypothetical protein ACFVHB_00385 [Kitasatospora sp. NPDC127111]|uniref:hypothetical protein n=1 Tax=Kitasatospora sp. NPDC127111 TaxID=3345363 RepID=UPI003628070E